MYDDSLVINADKQFPPNNTKQQAEIPNSGMLKGLKLFSTTVDASFNVWEAIVLEICCCVRQND